MQTSRERLEKILTQLDQRRKTERVFGTIYSRSARLEADAADIRRANGRSLGPLDGRIVSIKDLFDVKGEATLAGSCIRRSEPPASTDALIVKRLRQAGAVIVGKTHMTEFAFTAVGLNPHYGVPGNAIEPTRIPGGSSSGAAISVAEGTSEIAIGSDTGGSVRIPAALNGVVGFKPTARRIPLQGAFPLAPSLDSIGPLAKTVDDCILADAIIAGLAPSIPDAVALTDCTIGIPNDLLLDDMDPSVEAAFEAARYGLEKLGARLVTIELDDLIREFAKAARIGSIVSIEAARIHSKTWLHDLDANVDFRVRETLLKRHLVSDKDYAQLMEKRDELARRMNQRLQNIDCFITPATPILPVTIASVSEDEEEYERVEALLLRNTQIGNQFDLCSISLPMPNTPLPAGLMLTAAANSDRRLLALARSVEALLSR